MVPSPGFCCCGRAGRAGCGGGSSTCSTEPSSASRCVRRRMRPGIPASLRPVGSSNERTVWASLALERGRRCGESTSPSVPGGGLPLVLKVGLDTSPVAVTVCLIRHVRTGLPASSSSLLRSPSSAPDPARARHHAGSCTCPSTRWAAVVAPHPLPRDVRPVGPAGRERACAVWTLGPGLLRRSAPARRAPPEARWQLPGPRQVCADGRGAAERTGGAGGAAAAAHA